MVPLFCHVKTNLDPLATYAVMMAFIATISSLSLVYSQLIAVMWSGQKLLSVMVSCVSSSSGYEHERFPAKIYMSPMKAYSYTA